MSGSRKSEVFSRKVIGRSRAWIALLPCPLLAFFAFQIFFLIIIFMLKVHAAGGPTSQKDTPILELDVHVLTEGISFNRMFFFLFFFFNSFSSRITNNIVNFCFLLS
jgi:hypothetical protein